MYIRPDPSSNKYGAFPDHHVTHDELASFTEMDKSYINPYTYFRNYIFTPSEFYEMTKVFDRSFINYCEILVLHTGQIIMAAPSHQQALLKVVQVNFSQLDDEYNQYCLEHKNDPYMIRDEMDYLHWKSDAVQVWYDRALSYGKPTEDQLNTIKFLNEKKLINCSIQVVNPISPEYDVLIQYPPVESTCNM